MHLSLYWCFFLQSGHSPLMTKEIEGVKAFGQFETWNMDILHTEGTLARFAVEMNMPVVMIAGAFFFAEFVAEYASPIFEGMYHIMFQKEGKGTEDARLVHRNHLSFQIAQTLWVLFAHQCLCRCACCENRL